MRNRKWILALSLITIVSSAPAFAEGFGIHAGVNMANVSMTPSTTTLNSTMGIMGGIHYTMDMVPGFGVEAGLQYTQRGFSVSVLGVDVATKIAYVEVPVLAKISVGGLSFSAGPNLGFKAGVSCTSSAGTCTVTQSNLKSTNLGLEAGIGYEFGINPAAITLGARYHMGMSNLGDATTEMKNKGLQFLVGYNF